MAQHVALGIDVGTSALKGVLVGDDGTIVATASAEYPLSTPRPGWSEQDPALWWDACGQVCRELVAKPGVAVVAVGLSGQMHGSVVVDRAGSPLRPALLWNDARTGDECQEIERRFGAERLLAVTGNRASAGFQAPKILWLRKHEPELAARIAHVLLPKDFVRLRLTGELATEPSDASGTLLLDLARRRYSEDLLAACEIPRSWLPDIAESAAITGRVSGASATHTALPVGTPVVGGGGDNACAAVGAGVIAAGSGVCSLGTSGTVFVHASQPVIDPQGGLNGFCAATPDGWHAMGVVLSAGGALRWYRDGIEPGVGYDALLDQAAGIAAGADGVLFLPYLAGERSPHLDPSARAAWIGLSLAHDRRHMVRAVVEGIGFALTDCLDRMRVLGVAPPALVLVGGGASNPTWRAILAAQLDLALELRAALEGPALGAALLAGVGVGLWPTLEAATARALPRAGERIEPDPDLAARYRSLKPLWRALYPALRAVRAAH
jgi:xylulokinase